MNFEIFREKLNKNGIELTDEQISQFQTIYFTKR